MPHTEICGVQTALCFLEEEMSFVVTSEEETRHAQLFMENPVVTGSIALETEVIGKIRGLQFRAVVEKCDESLLTNTGWRI